MSSGNNHLEFVVSFQNWELQQDPVQFEEIPQCYSRLLFFLGKHESVTLAEAKVNTTAYLTLNVHTEFIWFFFIQKNDS